MKKFLVAILISICIFSLCACEIDDCGSYMEMVETFSEMKVDEIYALQNKGINFFLYTGRESCEYCGEFVHELVHASEEEGVRIYYLDSVTEYENSSEELKNFRDNYNIQYVPSLIYFEGKNVKNIFDNQKEYKKANFIEFIDQSLK